MRNPTRRAGNANSLARPDPFESGPLIHGTAGYAQVAYSGRVRLQGPESAYAGEVNDLYQAGVVRSIVSFYRQITEERFDYSTVSRAVDGVLTTILSREAAMRRVPLTMDKVLRENRRMELNLKGLKTWNFAADTPERRQAWPGRSRRQAAILHCSFCVLPSTRKPADSGCFLPPRRSKGPIYRLTRYTLLKSRVVTSLKFGCSPL